MTFGKISVHNRIFSIIYKHWFKYIKKYLSARVAGERWNYCKNNISDVLLEFKIYSQNFEIYSRSNQLEKCNFTRPSGRNLFFCPYDSQYILKKHFKSPEHNRSHYTY